MNKAQIVMLLEQGRTSFGQVAEHALTVLDAAMDVSIEESPTPRGKNTGYQYIRGVWPIVNTPVIK
jgi:hypothetical protein